MKINTIKIEDIIVADEHLYILSYNDEKVTEFHKIGEMEINFIKQFCGEINLSTNDKDI